MYSTKTFNKICQNTYNDDVMNGYSGSSFFRPNFFPTIVIFKGQNVISKYPLPFRTHHLYVSPWLCSYWPVFHCRFSLFCRLWLCSPLLSGAVMQSAREKRKKGEGECCKWAHDKCVCVVAFSISPYSLLEWGREREGWEISPRSEQHIPVKNDLARGINATKVDVMKKWTKCPYIWIFWVYWERCFRISTLLLRIFWQIVHN